jgi:hypothetical protein
VVNSSAILPTFKVDLIMAYLHVRFQGMFLHQAGQVKKIKFIACLENLQAYCKIGLACE